MVYSSLVNSGLFVHPMRLSALVNNNTKALYVLVLKFNCLQEKETFDICFYRVDYNKIRWAVDFNVIQLQSALNAFWLIC